MDIQTTLKERQATHGEFSDNADISQRLKEVVRSGVLYNELTPVEKEALDMICHKISRAVSAPYHADDYHDISGYASLVEKYRDKYQSDIDKLKFTRAYGRRKETT